MSGASLDLTSSYEEALATFLAHPGEHGLAAAYSIGRAAAGRGSGPLALVTEHERALRQLLMQRADHDAELDRILDDAARFLSEALTTHEMTYEGYHAQIALLRAQGKRLDAARAEADRANAAKSEFLSRMSHELRTPLNAILGFSQLLLHAELGQAEAEQVQYIYDAGEHLLSLINEILDLSRIEAGHVDLRLEDFALLPLVLQTVGMVQPLAASRRVDVQVIERDPR